MHSRRSSTHRIGGPPSRSAPGKQRRHPHASKKVLIYQRFTEKFLDVDFSEKAFHSDVRLRPQARRCDSRAWLYADPLSSVTRETRNGEEPFRPQLPFSSNKIFTDGQIQFNMFTILANTLNFTAKTNTMRAGQIRTADILLAMPSAAIIFHITRMLTTVRFWHDDGDILSDHFIMAITE